MQELLEKYAKVLLESCLKVEKNQPLFISVNIERIDFARIVHKIALNMGVKDIYIDIVDPYLKHDALKNLEVEELKELSYWNKENWNIYAKKNAAFLMLTSQTPGLMKDIDAKKMSAMTKYSYETRKFFDDMRDKSELAWCIAAVPTSTWAKELYPNAEEPVEELWNKIFDICSIKEENPSIIWNKKIEKLKSRAAKLTEYQFKELRYESSNGTSFKIGLPEKYRFASGNETLANGRDVLVNFPTEEVFTMPDHRIGEGTVVSALPLSFEGTLIKNFRLTFRNGRIEEFSAEEGEEALDRLLNSDEGSRHLGEVALVPFDSPVSNMGILFYNTLFDENASCHFAFGECYPTTIQNGESMTEEELFEAGGNHSINHVDFMVGTSDLSITGIKENGEEVPVFDKGNWVL